MVLDLLYRNIMSIVDKRSSYPFTIDQFAYDPIFTPDGIPSDESSMEPLWFYKHIFNKMADLANMDMEFGTKAFQYICDSQDIDEDIEFGDYSYFVGTLNENVPFLYMDPSHSWVFPSRLILYNPIVQIEINSDKKEIEIFSSIAHVRNLFFIKSEKKRKEALKNMLLNTDRPRLVN